MMAQLENHLLYAQAVSRGFGCVGESGLTYHRTDESRVWKSRGRVAFDCRRACVNCIKQKREGASSLRDPVDVKALSSAQAARGPGGQWNK